MPQETTPRHQTAGRPATRLDKDANAEEHHQKTARSRQTCQQIRKRKTGGNTRQQTAPKGQQRTAQGNRTEAQDRTQFFQHPRGLRGCTAQKAHNTKKNSTRNHSRRHRAPQHNSHRHHATTGDTATGDSSTATKRTTQQGTTRNTTAHHTTPRTDTAKTDTERQGKAKSKTAQHTTALDSTRQHHSTTVQDTAQERTT